MIPEPFGRHPDPYLPGLSAGWWPKGFSFPHTMPSDRPPLTQARLKELLHYDPDTGHFTWLVSRNSNTAVSGSRAGSINGNGYRQVRIDGRFYPAHRLAFLYLLGEQPPDHVDHINRDKSDNRWANLRPATGRENMGNVGLRGDNTSGHRGVSWNKRVGKWQVHGARDGRRIYLGLFDDLGEAAAAAQEWREENFGNFAAAGQPTPNPVGS